MVLNSYNMIPGQNMVKYSYNNVEPFFGLLKEKSESA